MKSLDKFGAILAVILIATIAYFSMSVVTKEVEVVVVEPYETVITDTLTITQIDTLWQFRSWKEDIIQNEGSIIVSKAFLFHIADDNVIVNQIRDALPFGEVFNFWRDKLGICGLFEWNDKSYITLYEEESILDCDVTEY